MESQTQEEEDRRRMLEDVQSDKATISRALTQNRTLKDQLAELQNGFVKLVRLKICPYVLFFIDTFCKRCYLLLYNNFYSFSCTLLVFPWIKLVSGFILMSLLCGDFV